jgi:hypothetical protein
MDRDGGQFKNCDTPVLGVFANCVPRSDITMSRAVSFLSATSASGVRVHRHHVERC